MLTGNTVQIGKTIMIATNESEAAHLQKERETPLKVHDACVNLQKATQPIREKNAKGNNLKKLILAELKILVKLYKIKEDGKLPTKKKDFVEQYKTTKNRPPIFCYNDNLQLSL